jgi:Ca2+/H+ antiporter
MELDMAKNSAGRRRRGAAESLGAIVLIFESVVMFLGALAIFGLKALPPEQALGGGAVLVVLIFATAGTLQWAWGIVLGSALQVAVLLTGFLVPAMWFVGALFSLLWAYAIYTGINLDKSKKEVTP